MSDIFIIDDSPIERLMVHGLLSKRIRDANFGVFEDAESALAAIEKHAPALILTDLQLPGMSGLELIQEVRRKGIASPVVLMTGYGSESLAVEAMLAGAASYVPKSGLSKYLVETVYSILHFSQRKSHERRVLESLFHQDLRFCIENDVSLVQPLIEMIQEQISTGCKMKADDQLRIGVALTEALTNAINHGNLELDSELRQEDESRYYDLGELRRTQVPYCTRQVYVGVTITAQEVDFRIQDEGPGFECKAAIRKAMDSPVDRIGGRGLLLIHSLMDSLSFNTSGNEIRFSKRVAAPVAENLSDLELVSAVR